MVKARGLKHVTCGLDVAHLMCLCGKSQLFLKLRFKPLLGPRRHYLSFHGLQGLFFKMWPSYWSEIETPGIELRISHNNQVIFEAGRRNRWHPSSQLFFHHLSKLFWICDENLPGLNFTSQLEKSSTVYNSNNFFYSKTFELFGTRVLLVKLILGRRTWYNSNEEDQRRAKMETVGR